MYSKVTDELRPQFSPHAPYSDLTPPVWTYTHQYEYNASL